MGIHFVISSAPLNYVVVSVVSHHSQGRWHLSGVTWMWSRPTLRRGRGILSSSSWR